MHIWCEMISSTSQNMTHRCITGAHTGAHRYLISNITNMANNDFWYIPGAIEKNRYLMWNVIIIMIKYDPSYIPRAPKKQTDIGYEMISLKQQNKTLLGICKICMISWYKCVIILCAIATVSIKIPHKTSCSHIERWRNFMSSNF